MKGADIMTGIYIFWLVVLVAAIAIEAASFTLISIWFALGALAAFIAAFCGAPWFIQIVVFLAVSIIALALTRPLLKKLMPKKYIPTNGELDIGKTAVVTERIDAAAGTGRVCLGGINWGANSVDGSVIEEGTMVVIRQKGAAYLTVEKTHN